MSCDEWERGTIKLPTKDYPKFRKEMLTIWNNYNLSIFETCKKILPDVRLAAKKSKGDIHLELEKAIKRSRSDYEDIYETVCRLMFDDKGKVRAPRKTDLELRKISAGGHIGFEDAGIYFDDDASSVEWGVSENNHSVDRSRRHQIAGHFFNKLASISWVRGTGGEIVGNDEYNRDDRNAGGGGNYVTSSYGPAYSASNGKHGRRRLSRY